MAGATWLTVATAFAQQSPPGIPAPTGSVSGDVVDETGQPVRNVTLVLFPVDEQKWAGGRESKAVQWSELDAGGAFAFSGVPPGEYRLAVSKEKVGDGGPDAAFIKALPRPLPVPVTAGGPAQVRLVVDADLKVVRAQRSGMQVVSSGLASSPTLPAGPGGRVSGPPGPPPGPRGPGAISGIVTGPDGQPIAGAHIQRFTSPLRNGVPQFAPTGPAVTTDDHGEYHLAGIVAGEYVVAALAQSFDFSAPGAPTVSHMPRAVAGSDGQKIGYVTTYYPGTDAPARATKVTVGVTEVTGINFTLQRQPMTDVTGTISGASAPAFDDAVVLLPESQAYGGGAPDARRIPISRDGTFTTPDVPFGLYVLNFSSARGWAHETFVVSANLAPLAITLKPPLVVKGRVEFLGDMPAPTGASLSPFRIRLTPAVLVTGSRLFEVPISATGEFTLPGVSAGRYILQSRTTPPWTEMSGKLGGEDTLDTPVELSESRDDAVVVLVDREAGISGTVKEVGDAPHDAMVVVYAADRQYWTSSSRRVRISRIVAGSGFSVSGLPPGRYLAFALPLSADTPAVNNALLEKYQGRAQRFDLVAREHRTIEIQMIR